MGQRPNRCCSSSTIKKIITATFARKPIDNDLMVVEGIERGETNKTKILAAVIPPIEVVLTE